MRIGINGFGRVGRVFLRIARQRGLDVVAVNDVTDVVTLAHLFAHDSVYGRVPAQVEHTGDTLVVDGHKVQTTAQRDPAGLRWSDLGVDVVVESTGKFRTRERAAAHLAAGAHKVLISAPAKGPVDATIGMGVNQETCDPALHDVVSNASCTTNRVAPMVDVPRRNFGLVHGFMTTIRGYTNDQRLLDSPHLDHPGRRRPGEGVRLERQRVRLHRAFGRPGRIRRLPAPGIVGPRTWAGDLDRSAGVDKHDRFPAPAQLRRTAR
jgi:glyceraldehyde 3-phosphate dehydrogenase (phosphorylating)